MFDRIKSTVSRAVLSVVASYDAGGSGRRMRGWNAPSTGPNRAISLAPKVRDRSRDAARNDWTASAGSQRWVTNLIGTGIVPRAKRIKDKAKKEAAAALWDRWTAQSDADCVLNFYAQEALVTRSWIESGEVFARLRWRRKGSMEVPLQVQVIESDFVPQLDTDSWPGLPVGNKIRQGIEIDRLGARVAYWIYKAHPTDFAAGNINISQLVRVPADEMLHVFEPKRPGQLRGVAEFASVLARLRNVADFDDAVLERQKIANLFAAFVEKQVPTAPDGINPITGEAVQTEADGTPVVAMQPGISQELLPGEKVVFSNPPEAGTTYSEYMRTQHLATAAGQGVPYELLSGDIINVSDRTLRVVIQEFRRFVEQRQWHVIIPMFCQKVRDAWVDQAVLVGALPMSIADDAKAVEWAPHGWQYIHPVQDVQGKQMEVAAGFRSRSSVIAQQGDDAEHTDVERAADLKREEELGLPTAPVQGANGPAGDNSGGVSPGQYPDSKKAKK
ncbi:phage portal protein [Cupriavidus sp. BIC8F]|uniref:phage portal protein n=1 Tax=Cupriavidus sp. BIC8F TaxID=3079014 RepID=UPI002916F78A|nr:phage portal protein [Cupriavidus sp. BIC8F]